LIDDLTDFRETAPAAAFQEMYQGNVEGSVTSGLASGVPGDAKGLEYVHQKYGVRDLDFSNRIALIVLQKLPWRAVVNPAVHVARYGFPGMHLT
jgi:gamma-glutamyltranspeptidase/glutathione hydrolase